MIAMSTAPDPRTPPRQMVDAAVAFAQPALCLAPHLPEPPSSPGAPGRR